MFLNGQFQQIHCARISIDKVVMLGGHDMEHQDWKRVRDVVTEEINRWDPLGLMDAGAPSDEFEPSLCSLYVGSSVKKNWR